MYIDDDALISHAMRKYQRTLRQEWGIVETPCAARSDVEGDRVVLRNVRGVMAIYRVRTRLEELEVVLDDGSADD